MKISDIFSEGWSNKYKRSINCSNPKGFSQKAHCAGRKKNESQFTDLELAIMEGWHELEKNSKQGMTEDTIRPNLVAALKGLGFKGPFKLEQLPEWMKELSDGRFDKDTSIMIGGDDPAYDAWVAKGYDYGYAYGMESGYQTGLSPQEVLRQAKSDMQGVAENFADGKVKGRSRPGRVKRAGASCDGSVTELRAKAKNASGEKAKMYHWCANMKAGKQK